MNTEKTEKMEKAWTLVNPITKANRLADGGLISRGAAAEVSWKDPITVLLIDEELEKEGLTIQEVEEAIIYYTATVPTVRREQLIAGTALVRFPEPKPGYFVKARGYAAGPAGDH